MTAPPPSDAAAPAVPTLVAPAALWWAEVRATVHLALPLIVTQLGQVAFRTIDTVMMGWLGPEQLAGGALGINFYFPLYLFGLGVGVAGSPMAAQALGAGDFRAVRHSVRQGFWAVTLVGFLFALINRSTDAAAIVAASNGGLADATGPGDKVDGSLLIFGVGEPFGSFGFTFWFK